ncbi:MAG: hypothetical protein K2Y05_03490 [Hyphomicrobiaceae bacterium]|nr:hypothetical protein [Hyphomicrobiaceae bacterium]
MSYPFEDDYRRRRWQVRRYFALVNSTERSQSSVKIDLDRLHILRAGSFLIVYNLIEATARASLQAIHDDMKAKRVPFHDLNDGIRREVVKGFKRNGNSEKHYDLADLPVDIVSASLDVEYHFSGNVDAKLLKAIAELYGLSIVADKARTRNGVDLLTIKTMRNDLAHGDKTYDDVGREYTARNLLEIGVRSLAYMEAFIGSVSEYLKTESYRRPPPPA